MEGRPGGGAEGYQRTLSRAAAAALEDAVDQIEPVWHGIAADKASGQLRQIARQTDGPQFKHGLDHRLGLVEGTQGIQAVEQQRQQFRVGTVLLGNGLRHLGEIAGQRKQFNVLPQGRELLLGHRLRNGQIAPLLRHGKFRIGQQLTGRLKGAAAAPDATGFHGHRSMVPGKHRQQPVMLFVVGLPQNDALGLPVHGFLPVMYGPHPAGECSLPRPRASVALSPCPSSRPDACS